MTDFASNRRIAMLIDGDNATPSLMDKMIAETSKYGVVNIRRIYGDWTESTMNSWKQTLHTFAVQPIQQFRYTVGKNATDSALIIDAMDILYTTGVDGFCLVSSDSDYTRLAMRIREKNLFVMGIGRRLTPRAFVNACDTFVYQENLIDESGSTAAISLPVIGRQHIVTISHGKNANRQAAAPAKKAVPTPTPPKPEEKTPGTDDALFGEGFDPDTENVTPNLETLFIRAFDLAVGDNGWSNLSALGSVLRQLDPAFDPRTYGHKQLGLLVKAHPDIFEVRQPKNKDGVTGSLQVRPIKRVRQERESGTLLLPAPALTLPSPLPPAPQVPPKPQPQNQGQQAQRPQNQGQQNQRPQTQAGQNQRPQAQAPQARPQGRQQQPASAQPSKSGLPTAADILRFSRFEHDDDEARDEMAWLSPTDIDEMPAQVRFMEPTAAPRADDADDDARDLFSTLFGDDDAPVAPSAAPVAPVATEAADAVAVVQPAEPAPPQARQQKPAQPRRTQPEPAQPEPAQPEPAQPEPAQPEPAQPEPAQPEPAQPELAQPEPAGEPAAKKPRRRPASSKKTPTDGGTGTPTG